MKNRYLITIISLLFSTLLSAKEGIILSISGVGMSMDYREYSDNNKLYDTEESTLNSIVGLELKVIYLYEYENKDYAQIGFKIMGVGGETDYIGAIIGSGLGYGSHLSKTQNNIMDLELEYTYNYILENNVELILGIGLGNREWTRTLSPYQIEIYSWYSLRPKIGLKYNYLNFSLAGSLEYQYGLKPKMSLDIPETFAILTLGSADITKFTIPIKYNYSNEFNIFTEYVYEKQIIGKSNTVDGWLEPRSEAYNQYLKFGAEFKF